MMLSLYVPLAVNRKVNTNARLYTNPYFDLCMQIEEAQMRFLCRTPNLAHHNRTRSSEIWEDFEMEPLGSGT